MYKKSFIVTIGVLSLLILTTACFAQQETLTITTYYPAPFGVYAQLVTQTLGVGDSNGSGGIDAGDAPDPIVAGQEGDVWIAGDVGIGTTTPQNKLDIFGSVAIGSNYAGVNAAPVDGLLIEGGVGIGIGITSPMAKVDIQADGNTASTFGLLIRNSDNSPTLALQNNGRLNTAESLPRKRPATPQDAP